MGSNGGDLLNELHSHSVTQPGRPDALAATSQRLLCTLQTFVGYEVG